MTGTFTVPTPSGEGSASAWVGIDGDTCDNAILQTGVDFTVSGGSVSYDGAQIVSSTVHAMLNARQLGTSGTLTTRTTSRASRSARATA